MANAPKAPRKGPSKTKTNAPAKRATATESPTKEPVPGPAPGPAPEPVAEPELTGKQRLFIEHYVVCWNASEAARRAGYSLASAGSIGSENLKKPEISAVIEAKLAEVKMGASEVLAHLSDIGRGSLKPFLVEDGEGNFYHDFTTETARDKLHLLKKLKTKRRTHGSGEAKETEVETEIEIHDPVAALTLLGRHHKLFTDKIEQSVTNKPVQEDDLSDLNGLEPGELNRRIEAALKAPAGG